MDKVFVDSDIILDFLLDRSPFAEPALKLFTLAEMGRVKLFTSGIVFSNCYYVLRRVASHDKVIKKLATISLLFDFTLLERQVVLDALQSSFRDFKDALQNFSAIGSGIQILITRNIRDYKWSSLAVMSPDQFLGGWRLVDKKE
ncbi:MAG: PIN domain-containing protein [Bacteroidota bacterium]|nr:PIN domain-containing protein [Bacteroidota bacterium]